MNLPQGIEIVTGSSIPRLLSRLRCMNCGADTELKHKARFLRRHPMECVKAKIERRRFVKQLAQGTRSVDDTERRGGKYGNY